MNKGHINSLSVTSLSSVLCVNTFSILQEVVGFNNIRPKHLLLHSLNLGETFRANSIISRGIVVLISEM